MHVDSRMWTAVSSQKVLLMHPGDWVGFLTVHSFLCRWRPEGCYLQKSKVAGLDPHGTYVQYMGTIVNGQLLVPRRKGVSFNK